VLLRAPALRLRSTVRQGLCTGWGTSGEEAFMPSSREESSILLHIAGGHSQVQVDSWWEAWLIALHSAHRLVWRDMRWQPC